MKNFFKWFLSILVIVVLLIASAGWYLSKNWKPIIESKLKEVLLNSSDSLYTLQYSDLDINVPFGNISLDSVELIPNPDVYKKLVKSKKAPNNQYHIKLDALSVKHFSLTDIFFNRKLSIKKIALVSPTIDVMYEHQAYNDTVANTPKKSLYDDIKHLLVSLDVEQVEVDKASVNYTKKVGRKITKTAVKGVTIKVNDFLVDSTSAQDPSRLFLTKEIDVQVPGFLYNLPRGIYKVALSNLHLNTKDNIVEVKNFIFRPRMSKSGYFRAMGQNITMSDIKFGTVKMKGLDFRRLLNHQEIFGKSLEIANGFANFSEDMRYPKHPKNKIGHAPYQKLMLIKNIFHFSTVFVNNITVAYDDYSAKYQKLGYISFNNASGNLSNVTNDRALLRRNRFMRADLRARVMNVGKLHVKFGFDMLSKNGSYTYVGAVGPMKAIAFNKILIPLVNVQIASGNIKGISFDMKATEYKNWGSFKFDYDSLKVNILGAPKDGKKDSPNKALSFIVNQALINQSNPDVKGVYHVGNVQYTRVPEFSFFKTIWQSLLQGIVQCTGISPKTEATLLGAASTGQHVVSKFGKIIKGTEKVAVDVGKGVGKAGKAVGAVATKVGKGVGKEATTIVHGTDSLFKRIFKKKKKQSEEEQ